MARSARPRLSTLTIAEGAAQGQGLQAVLPAVPPQEVAGFTAAEREGQPSRSAAVMPGAGEASEAAGRPTEFVTPEDVLAVVAPLLAGPGGKITLSTSLGSRSPRGRWKRWSGSATG